MDLEEEKEETRRTPQLPVILVLLVTSLEEGDANQLIIFVMSRFP